MAKRFIFTLRDVLDHRENIEELRKKDFARANDDLKVLLNQKEYLLNKERLLREELNSRRQAKYDPSMINVYDVYLDYMETEKANLEKSIMKQRDIVEQKRQELIKAQRDKEVLIKLKEDEYKAYLKEETMEENKFFDFLATRKFFSRQ